MANSCAVLIPPTNDTPAVVRVTVDGKTDLYWTMECATDVPGHRLFDVVRYRAKDRGHEKAVARYSVLVEQPRKGQPARGSCDCKGGTYERVDTCRHVMFISAMWGYGYLTVLLSTIACLGAGT